MVGRRLAQVIAQVPQHAEPIRCMAHELSLRANALKEQHESQFEEHDGTNEGTTTVCIGLLYKLPDK
jgi:hypothetical protein